MSIVLTNRSSLIKIPSVAFLAQAISGTAAVPSSALYRAEILDAEMARFQFSMHAPTVQFLWDFVLPSALELAVGVDLCFL